MMAAIKFLSECDLKLGMVFDVASANIFER